jgi:hypothetical protein
MAMGKRKRHRQASLWVETARLAKGPAHSFYRRLNQILGRHGFDDYVERACQEFYADKLGRPSASMRRRWRPTRRCAASSGGTPARATRSFSLAWRRRRVQTFVVQQLACFLMPSEVVAAVAEEFGIAIDRQQAWRYNPANDPALAPKWRLLFEETRAAFVRV